MSDMVLVACKSPNGLVLNLDHYETDGPRNAVRRVDGPQTVTLKGWTRPFGAPDHTEGGYALTAVPLAFWELWFEQNKNSPLIVDKIILPPHKDSLNQARAHREVPQMFAPARGNEVAGVKAEKATA